MHSNDDEFRVVEYRLLFLQKITGGVVSSGGQEDRKKGYLIRIEE